MNLSKIAVEEHMAPSGTLDRVPDRFDPEAWRKLSHALVARRTRRKL
jgi:hypothetical protein